mmetsp:Transcript_27353/g.88339  ORF Transcript_27353/g.88339 Transcript_27353/m.88339 type:complete len:286 (+) Transcript_27353:398-1255(+)
MCSYVCRLSTEHAGVLLPPQETLCRQAARISRAVSPSQGLAPELVVGLASGPPLLGLLADLVDHGLRLLLERVPFDHLLLQVLLKLLLRVAVLAIRVTTQPEIIGDRRLRRQVGLALKGGLAHLAHHRLLLLPDCLDDDVQLLVALSQHICHVVVCQCQPRLVDGHAVEPLCQVLDSRLDRHQHFCQPLVFVPLPLVLALRLPGRRHLLPFLSRRRVLQPLHTLVRLALLLRERVEFLLRFLSQLLQILVRRFLRDEFLDHLVDIGHAGRLLDLPEGRFVRCDLL